MSASTSSSTTAQWWTETDCRLDEFAALVEQETRLADYPLADSVAQNVLVYDCSDLRTRVRTPTGRRDVQAELVRALSEGPGVLVFARAFTDREVVDRATAVFEAMITRERDAGVAAGDHFAKPGANDRVWNALEKLAVDAPHVFADYYANEILALVATAWLGPAYQVTSQVNVVNPGGAAQSPHRDYHLGFMSDEQAARYPAHVHRLSPALTLQGAVAHSDMPVHSGPTMYLPYSHQYGPGYLAWRRPEFAEYFARHLVQLPLRAGDAAFFNPAVLHGAGHNASSDIKRMANLLQVSSAFGRAMETVDRARVSEAVFPVLRQRRAAGVPEEDLLNVVAAAAEGYGFPTNLDRDQPIDGLAPETQAELLWRAVRDQLPDGVFERELAAHSKRRTATP